MVSDRRVLHPLDPLLLSPPNLALGCRVEVPILSRGKTFFLPEFCGCLLFSLVTSTPDVAKFCGCLLYFCSPLHRRTRNRWLSTFQPPRHQPHLPCTSTPPPHSRLSEEMWIKKKVQGIRENHVHDRNIGQSEIYPSLCSSTHGKPSTGCAKQWETQYCNLISFKLPQKPIAVLLLMDSVG